MAAPEQQKDPAAPPADKTPKPDPRLGYGKRKGGNMPLIIILIWALVVGAVAMIRTFVQTGGQ